MKTGHWVYRSEPGKMAWLCSECGTANKKIPPFIVTRNGLVRTFPYGYASSGYCPTCGARMMPEEEEKNGR